MAKKPVKKTTTRRPSIMLVDFIEQEGKNIGNADFMKSDLVIENKIVKDDCTSDILFPEYDVVRFTNVSFTGKVSLCFHPETHVVFDECVFDKKPVITGAYEIGFKKCKFKSCIEVSNIKYYVEFDNCEAKEFVDIERCNNASIRNSTVYEVRASKCLEGELYFSDCVIKQIDVINSHCSDFSACSIKCERIKLTRCYFDDVFITNSFNNTLETLTLRQVHISDSLDVYGQRINTFNAYCTTVMDECRFRTDYIKNWTLRYTNGIVPPSNEIILYKKVAVWHGSNRTKNGVIAKLVVPAEAKRVYCGLHKLRVSEAKCVGFYNYDGTEYKLRKGYVITSLHSDSYYYELNKICKPSRDFDGMPGTCGSGIHGFIEFDEAVKY